MASPAYEYRDLYATSERALTSAQLRDELRALRVPGRSRFRTLQQRRVALRREYRARGAGPERYHSSRAQPDNQRQEVAAAAAAAGSRRRSNRHRRTRDARDPLRLSEQALISRARRTRGGVDCVALSNAQCRPNRKCEVKGSRGCIAKTGVRADEAADRASSIAVRNRLRRRAREQREWVREHKERAAELKRLGIYEFD